MFKWISTQNVQNFSCTHAYIYLAILECNSKFCMILFFLSSFFGPWAHKATSDGFFSYVFVSIAFKKMNLLAWLHQYQFWHYFAGLICDVVCWWFQVRVQSDPEGRLVITGQPEQRDNPWGITAFKKVNLNTLFTIGKELEMRNPVLRVTWF